MVGLGMKLLHGTFPKALDIAVRMLKTLTLSFHANEKSRPASHASPSNVMLEKRTHAWRHLSVAIDTAVYPDVTLNAAHGIILLHIDPFTSLSHMEETCHRPLQG